MTDISIPFSDILGQLGTGFQKSTAAAALFYYDDQHQKGLRIECTELMKEFSNGVDFGRDPEGLLFYNVADDFENIDSLVIYKIFYHTGTKTDSNYVKIDFFLPSTGTDPFTSFLARDNDRRIQRNRLVDGEGAWTDLKTGTCSTKIVKKTVENTVTLTMESIEKQVTFKVTDNHLKQSINTSGIFYFPSMAALSGEGGVANYDDDRIVFYPNANKSQMLAVFFPTDGKAMGINNYNDPNPSAITWSNT